MRFLSFLLLCCLCQFSNAQTGGKNFALFFANRDYNSHPTFKSLTNPIKDARAVEKELEEMYGFETYVYEDKDRRFILATLQQWLNRRFGKNDQLFIFFSGHGTFDELTSTGYFVPWSRRDDVATYIDLT